MDGECHQFWTNIMQVITGKHHTEQRRDVLWSQIAFYNYIQESLDDSRVAPDEHMWENAKLPFVEMLNCVNPNKILVFGQRRLCGNIQHPSSGFSSSSWSPLVAEFLSNKY
jgi:hypothetical protein